jgi:FK506-binding protein 8
VPSKSELYLTVRLVAARQLPPVPDIPLEERAKIGNEKRLRGNRWYSRGDHSMAVQCYRKAVEYLDDESIESELEVCMHNSSKW